MAQKSTLVVNRNANARYVISAASTHGDEISANLAAIDGALPANVQLGAPALRAVVTWLGAVLESADDTLDRTEQDYVAEQADDPPVRAARDDATATLLAVTQRARDRIEGVLGSDEVATYGLGGRTPRQPGELAEHVKTAVSLLRARPQTVTDGIGGQVDTGALADALEQQLATLEQALAAITREGRELEAAMLARDAAADAWTDAYQGVANALTGLFRLAGRGDLAERVRPTTRRASGEDPAPEESAAREADPETPETPEAPAEACDHAGGADGADGASTPSESPTSAGSPDEAAEPVSAAS